MKRLVIIISAVLLIFILSGCIFEPDKVVDSLGNCEKEEFYTSGGFQDFTDYAKYYFVSSDIEDNEYFIKLSDDSIDVLNQYIDNFEGWIECIEGVEPDNEVVINYDFDRSIIDTDDYGYVFDMCTKESDVDYNQFECYDAYFFDFQTQVLFYFHNNI